MNARRVSRRTLLKSAGAVVGGMALSACTPVGAPSPAAQVAGESATGGPMSGGVVRIAVSGNSPSSLCRIDTESSRYEELMRSLWAKVVSSNVDFTDYIGDLAESWEWNEDNTRVRYHLRENAKWHDGVSVTADDLVFTFWTVAREPKMPGHTQWFREMIRGLQDAYDGKEVEPGVVKVDDLTVDFFLSRPIADGPWHAAIDPLPVHPWHILKEYPVEKAHENPICQGEVVANGPFKFKRTSPDQFIEVEAFEDYHFGRPMLDGIIFKLYPDWATISVALEKGELDVGRILVDDIPLFDENPDFNIHVGPPGAGGFYVGPNHMKPYLADMRVRQAMAHAIDKESIVENIFHGYADVLHTLAGPYPGIGVSPNITEYEYDPDKARALLEEANWDFEQVLKIYASEVQTEPFHVAVVGMLQAVGFKIEYEITADYWKIGSTEHLQDLVIGLGSMGLDPNTAVMEYASWRTEDRPTWVVMDDPRFDEISQVIEESLDNEEHKQATWQLQELASAEAILHIPICSNPAVWAINNKVHGYRPNWVLWPMNNWELHKVWLEA